MDGDAGLDFAGWAKLLTSADTISVGSVGLSGDFMGALAGEGFKAASLDTLIHRMERGEFDLIAVGRAILNDPHWVAKVRAGDETGLRDFTAASFGEPGLRRTPACRPRYNEAAWIP